MALCKDQASVATSGLIHRGYNNIRLVCYRHRAHIILWCPILTKQKTKYYSQNTMTWNCLQ